MSQTVFTAEYCEGQYEIIRKQQEIAVLNLENAVLKATIATILQIGGNALHSLFEAGGEPKWRHPSEREAFIDLSNTLESAHRQITGGAA